MHRAGWSQGLSLDDFKKTAAALFAIFANTHYGIDEMLAEQDTVVVRWTYQADHVGEYMGIAGIGKPVKTWAEKYMRVGNSGID